ncbi:MAG: hypothetical protein HC934_12180 [Acaryochloridaceae cyanobacterium SU_2_1]|nr:hypothetical protein [Acaryochloridaceae cyanobacterium SU_2_1]
MYNYPFDLLQVQLTDADGKRVFKPQWLIGFYRVIGQIGTPANTSQPRGKASGWQVGHRVDPRPRRSVVKGTRARPKQIEQAAELPTHLPRYC